MDSYKCGGRGINNSMKLQGVYFWRIAFLMRCDTPKSACSLTEPNDQM